MEYQAWFQCQKGCGERYSLYEVVYRCKKCGSLLEVAHDIEALRDRSAQEWKDLFDARYMRHAYPYGSAVWGKKEWVCPTIDEANIISMYEGGTNLFWADRLGRQLGLGDLWVKQCGNSHTGSFKDLGMTVLVSVVKQITANGTPIKAVACASTGDTSASLAAYCAAAGIPCVVFLPKEKVSSAQLIQPIANGALVLSLDTDFDGCMAIVQQVTEEHDIYLANSLNSLRIEGQKTVSVELVQQFDWQVPDVIIIPGGNLGNVSALGRGFWMMKELGLIDRLPRLVCAQAEQANPLYRSYLTGFKTYQPIVAQRTLATAIQIGNPVSIERATKTLQLFDGIVEQASEDELANAAARADLTGMYNCPHTGVALAVLFKLLDRGHITPRERVVVISTAHGLKFTDFKIAYHERRLQDVASRHANPPVTLPPKYGAVRDAIRERLKVMA
ncbi:MAG: threonine synthase [Nitrospinae bacterium]|nr:threonine synthase [Nitrospinota bacterium]